MKELILSIARQFLKKNIPFSVYRFPGDEGWKLAVDSDVFPHQTRRIFRMSPFIEKATSAPVALKVLPSEQINRDWLRQVENMAMRKVIDLPLSREMSKAEYLKRLDDFLAAIRTREIQKAILSRVFYESKPNNFDPLFAFSTLTSDHPGAFVYLSLHPVSGLWLGASPELLVRAEKSKLQTIALAGTQAKDQNHAYYWRNKEWKEHQMVSRHVEEVFDRHGYALLRKNGPINMETDSVAHLKTEYCYRPKRDSALGELVRDLHPTPAIAGLPVDKSLACIQEHEGYDRTYYCGIIGETGGEEEAHLYINLRCMQVGSRKIAIYVGGGITEDSDPEEEWQETILKGETMRKQIHSTKEEKRNGVIQ